MDLLGATPNLTLQDSSWRIYSRNNARPPQFIGASADVRNSVITEGCEIYGTVINSVLSPGVVVEEGAVVYDSVIFDDVIIRAGAEIHYTVMDGETEIGAECKVGKPMELSEGITLVGGGLNVPPRTVIADNVRFGKDELAKLINKEVENV